MNFRQPFILLLKTSRFLLLTAFPVLIVSVAWPNKPSLAASTIEQISLDQKAFREFFSNRFPELELTRYSEGAPALPQFSRQRAGYDLLKAAPPYDSVLREAAALWKQPLANGSTLTQCFSGKPPPTAYPFLFEGVVHTLESDINDCFVKNGSQPLELDSGMLAAAVAVYKNPFRGQPIDIDIRDQQVRALYDEGKQYFWAKRGQMNLSCANCHVHNAGNQLRGEVLSPALGHGAGFPAFSMREFSKPTNVEGGGAQPVTRPMQNLHERYQQCNIIAGAAPLALQSQTYLALEIYQAVMNSDLPIDAPGLRP